MKTNLKNLKKYKAFSMMDEIPNHQDSDLLPAAEYDALDDQDKLLWIQVDDCERLRNLAEKLLQDYHRW